MFPLLDSNSNLSSVYNSSQTVKFLRSCHLEVGMKNNVRWELNPEIVARHFLRNVSTPKHHCTPKMEATPGKKQLLQD